MKGIDLFVAVLALIAPVGAIAQESVRTHIEPGEAWNDIDGNFINAHGSCVIFHGGKYYWYGEDRTGMKSNGVSCYSSDDLMNWKREGLALSTTGEMRDDMNDISDGRLFERPKVIYNANTKQFVMWSHWERNKGDYGAGRVCVAYSDKPTGPFVFHKTMRPNNHDSRDQTLFLDNDGTAYHIGSTDMNTNTLVTKLDQSYLEPTELRNKSLLGKKCEAASIFRVGDCYFGLFSGCTGWDPNPGRIAYTYDLLGDWTYADMNFAVDKDRNRTYGSQSAYVLPVNGKDNAFVYIGDRWNSKDVEHSTQVWLPISMRSGYPTVTWHEKWNLDVFNDMYRYKRAAEIEKDGKYALLEKYSNRLVSHTKRGFTLEDDDDSLNVSFRFVDTGKEGVYKIMNADNGKFIESVFGTLRINPEKDSASQLWELQLQPDGYYKIRNLESDKYLSVSGASTFSGTSLYLSQLSDKIPQDFAVYFDSSRYDYKEADIFSRQYRDDIAQKLSK